VPIGHDVGRPQESTQKDFNAVVVEAVSSRAGASIEVHEVIPTPGIRVPKMGNARVPTAAEMARTGTIAVAIALLPQGAWSGLIVANLRVLPGVPWAAAVMVLLLAAGAQYLRGAWGPARSATARRRSLRATVVSRQTFVKAWLAGGLAMMALGNGWIVLASITRMPGSVLPDLSGYPRATALISVAMGALISPLCEQAGIWGYWQECAERRWSAVGAVLSAALIFGLLPHPPAGAPLVPKLVFFFATGLTFSALAYHTQSILPAIPVHAIGLFVFFLAIWPHDPERQLVLTAGPDEWFWIHIAQTIVCGALAAWILSGLRQSARL
jgi:membrane protease YdiL (CAAX protease family)